MDSGQDGFAATVLANTRGEEDVWAIVEVFGRQSFPGKIREKEFLGSKFLEVRIPEHTIVSLGEAQTFPESVRLFSPSAIYGISKCSEAYARQYLLNPYRDMTIHAEPTTATIEASPSASLELPPPGESFRQARSSESLGETEDEPWGDTEEEYHV